MGGKRNVVEWWWVNGSVVGVGLNISIQNTHEIIIKADEQQIFLIPHIFLWVIFVAFAVSPRKWNCILC